MTKSLFSLGQDASLAASAAFPDGFAPSANVAYSFVRNFLASSSDDEAGVTTFYFDAYKTYEVLPENTPEAFIDGYDVEMGGAAMERQADVEFRSAGGAAAVVGCEG